MSIGIIGAGGLGREILQVLHDMGQDCAGFVVDPQFSAPENIDGIVVHRDTRILSADPKVQFVIAIGDPEVRTRIARELEDQIGARFASIIHPRAWIGANVTIGHGSMIFGFCSITSNTVIGRHVLINPGTTIAHDCILGDFATLAPSCALAGGTIIDESATLGIGAKVLPKVRVGRSAVVGGGAVCVHDVKSHTTVVGVPARPISQ